ncbi:hypothetical protein GCM10010401_06560 [Rarobacter faecitabidus]|uniref:tyrosine-type recombinase/integrase n=1 Tax=Rarobacter faecitabidus TaxID=13243 RepID=UPI001152D6CB
MTASTSGTTSRSPRATPLKGALLPRDHNWRQRVWRYAIKDAGLEGEGLTPHKLRHTAASSAIAAGADVKVVQQMLGHKDATETLNTYGHLWPDRLDEVAEALEMARETALKEAPVQSHVYQMCTEPGLAAS